MPDFFQFYNPNTKLISHLKYFRPHSSLNNFAPFKVHHCSHTASLIARYQSGLLKRHQRLALRMFNNSHAKRFQINDKVLIKTKRHAFQKSSPIFYPTYEKDNYIITNIDKKYLPWKYFVTNCNNMHIKKQLYAFEMLKIMHNNISHQPSLHDMPKSIHIYDIIKQNASQLRSGRTIDGKEVIFYRVTINNTDDIISEKGLRVLLKSLSSNSISYSAFFDKLENRKYIIH